MIGKSEVVRKISETTIPIRRLLSCTNEGGESKRRLGTESFDDEPYETMESMQIQDIDSYIDAILKNQTQGSAGSPVHIIQKG